MRAGLATTGNASVALAAAPDLVFALAVARVDAWIVGPSCRSVRQDRAGEP